MLSCYELRIGNYILADGKLQEITMISRTNCQTVDAGDAATNGTFEHSLNDIDSILLTDEIIRACGFVYHTYFKFWQLITTGIRSEMNIDPDYAVIDFMRRPIGKKLTSLHHLQNFYFLLKDRELKVDTKEIVADSMQ
jgi:hypothetical protein